MSTSAYLGLAVGGLILSQIVVNLFMENDPFGLATTLLNWMIA